MGMTGSEMGGKLIEKYELGKKHERGRILAIINEVEKQVLSEDKTGASRDMIVSGTVARIVQRINK